jgi:hypothetical protein
MLRFLFESVMSGESAQRVVFFHKKRATYPTAKNCHYAARAKGALLGGAPFIAPKSALSLPRPTGY